MKVNVPTCKYPYFDHNGIRYNAPEMSYFPITIMYTDTGQLAIVAEPGDIEDGRGFIVKSSNNG